MRLPKPPPWLEPVTLAAIIVAGFLLRSSEIVRTKFLLDGDPYLHGLLVKYIAQTGLLPTTIPQQVPPSNLFYPLGSHALLGSLMAAGLALEPLLRWFGPILSVLFSLGLYLFAWRLTRSRTVGLATLVLSLFIPFLTTRLSISLPEHFFMLATLLCLVSLVEWVRTRRWGWLVLAILAVGGGFAVHFSSYFLLPPLITGMLLGFLPEKLKIGPILKGLGVGILVIAAGAAIIYVSYPLLYQTLRSFANTASANPEFLPAPTLVAWRRELNTAVLILAIPGALWLFRPKLGLGWRPLAIVTVYTVTILMFLQILPSLHLYNLLPFRAFTYFAIPLALAAGAGVVAAAEFWQVWGVLAVLLLILGHATLGPAGWDIDLIPQEVDAIHWLNDHTADNTLVYTQPIIGKEISLYSHDRVNYDLSYFLAPEKTEDIVSRFQGFQKAQGADKTYVFISDYKLGPEYNKGFTRGGTLADVPLGKISSQNDIFHEVFQNDAVRIYQVNLQIPPVKKSPAPIYKPKKRR